VRKTSNESSLTSNEKMDLATELHNSLASVMVREPMKNSADQFPFIQTEFKFKKKSGTRSPNLDKLFLALETIQPMRVLNKNSQPNVVSKLKKINYGSNPKAVRA
jgi:hypothetical protein